MKEKVFNVFVVEDNEWYNKLLVHNIELNPSYKVTSFHNGKSLLNNLDKNPDVITLDYRLPDFSGSELLQKIKSSNPETNVIIISEQEEIEVALDLLKNGATDYLVKSKDIKERLHICLNRIFENISLKREVKALKEEVGSKYSFDKYIVGESIAIQSVFKWINKAISTPLSVMISGETGTGKEVVAKAIHYSSNRKKQNFVAVNVAAIPSDLIESELFGHEKGAFTGAETRRIGKFEEANGGTLFLDEIGEMDLNFQTKLLRVLQEKEICRVGSNNLIKVDCRIIVATHRNLEELVAEGKFREDLYYRLYGLPIELPPLRERNQDIILLANHFIDLYAKENKVSTKEISKDACQKLLMHTWKGNVRELKSVIDLAMVMSDKDWISAEDVLLNSKSPEVNIQDEPTLREYNRRLVKSMLEKYGGDRKLVAKKLDIGLTTVYRLLNEDLKTE